MDRGRALSDLPRMPIDHTNTIRESSVDDSMDVLRLSPKKLEQLIVQMTRQASKHQGSCNRIDQRYACHETFGQVVEITHPGGTKNLFLIAARNISRGGLAFFHGGYVYNDSLCRFLLTTTDGQRVGINGEVKRCTPVEGRIHEVGVQFDQSIDINLFVTNTMEKTDIGTASQPIPRLRGRVLLIDPKRNGYETLRKKLDVAGARLQHAADFREARMAITTMGVDMILCALDAGEQHATQVIDQLREANYHGPVAVWSDRAPTEFDTQRLAAVDVRDVLTIDASVHSIASTLARFIAVPAA